MGTITLEQAQTHFRSIASKSECVGFYADVFADKARQISDFYKSGKMGSTQAISMLGGYLVTRHKPVGMAADEWKKNVLKHSTVLSQKYSELVDYINKGGTDLNGEIIRLRATIAPKTVEFSGVMKSATTVADNFEAIPVLEATEAIALVTLANRLLAKAGVKPVDLKVNLQVAS